MAASVKRSLNNLDKIIHKVDKLPIQTFKKRNRNKTVTFKGKSREILKMIIVSSNFRTLIIISYQLVQS